MFPPSPTQVNSSAPVTEPPITPLETSCDETKAERPPINPPAKIPRIMNIAEFLSFILFLYELRHSLSNLSLPSVY